MASKKTFTVMVDARNLDCVKKTIRVINNCIYEECGVISEYNIELLEALLGKDWHKEYCLGERYIEEDSNE